jgi:hypothetical protein
VSILGAKHENSPTTKDSSHSDTAWDFLGILHVSWLKKGKQQKKFYNISFKGLKYEVPIKKFKSPLDIDSSFLTIRHEQR